MKLTEPVPQPQSHEDKPWFHSTINREQAENMLRRLPQDGAFIVRCIQRDDAHFAISFR